jgi:glycosyltransferase involved in cell wall biosynthesis
MTLRQILRRIVPPIVADGVRHLRGKFTHYQEGLQGHYEHQRSTRNEDYWQDCQVVKERCEDSPGILVLWHGNVNPTPERLAALERCNYLVISVIGGRSDRKAWLRESVCIGALLLTEDAVNWAETYYPDKVVLHSDAMSLNMLRTMTQEPANILPIAGYSSTSAQSATASLKTIDIVSCWISVPIKRTELLIESAIRGNLSAYVISHIFGADDEVMHRLNRVLDKYHATLEPFYLPFEPYAIHKIGERIVIDGRPFGIGNGILPSILDKARVYVHASETESGFSNAIVEALMRNVPVLVCADVKGPLLELAEHVRPAITICEPTPGAIADGVKRIITDYHKYHNVREKFGSYFDPFETNRRFVKRCQELFRTRGIPWKGHCQGLMGGAFARFNVAEDIPGLEQSSGQQRIFPNPALGLRYLNYQISLARKANNRFALGVLETERALIDTTTEGKRPRPDQLN